MGANSIQVPDKSEFSIPEAAIMLGLHRSTVWMRVREGIIPTHVVSPSRSKVVRRKISASWLKKELADDFGDAMARLAMYINDE